MNQSLSFNVNTAAVISRYIVETPPANAGETAMLDILRTTDDSGLYFYGDLSGHGGDIANIDSTAILSIVSGSSVSITVARRAAALLVKIKSSPNLSDIISFGFINSTHIRRSIPVSNISLRDIATEFNSTTTNSKIRLYSGGESGVSASVTGVQRSFSEFANKEFKIIKYLSNSSTGVNLTTLFSADLAKLNSKKAIANANVLIGTTVSTATPIEVSASWTGNIDLVNYGVIMGAGGNTGAINGGNVINMPSSINGTLQVVNVGELLAGGGAGGRGGYGANGFVYNNAGSIIVNYAVGGDPGANSAGAGYAQLAINYNVGGTGNLVYAGNGGRSSHGGLYGQAADTGLLGANGILIRQACSTVTNTVPILSGIWGPQIGGAGGYVIIGNGKTYYSELGSNIGAISGVVNNASGIGEVLTPPASTQYIIPKDSVIIYNGDDPNYYEWEYYTPATDKFIVGTGTQGDVATTISASGTTSIDTSSAIIGTAGAHSYNMTVLQGDNPTNSVFWYTKVDGAHSHTITASTITTNPLPAKRKSSLLRAISDQTKFPSGSKYINGASRSSTSVKQTVTNDNEYIFGAQIDTGSAAKVAVTSSITTSSTGIHDHNSNTVRPSLMVGTQTLQYVGTRNMIVETRLHTHVGATASINLDTLDGKLLSIWTDATANIPCTNDILMYCGDLSLLPSYWKICDGNNGTIDMRNYFFGHAKSSIAHGTVTTKAYSATLPNGSLPTSTWYHGHMGLTRVNTVLSSYYESHEMIYISHTHTVSGITAVSTYLPAHIKLAFIQFIP